MTVENRMNDDGRVIAMTSDGVDIARLNADDEVLEQNDEKASIKTTASSGGKVVGNPVYEILFEVPADRASVLSLLARANAQARTNAVNAARRPEGLDNELKALLRNLKAADPDAIEALKKELQSRKESVGDTADE